MFNPQPGFMKVMYSWLYEIFIKFEGYVEKISKPLEQFYLCVMINHKSSSVALVHILRAFGEEI